MTKEQLIEIIKRLLETDADLDFLSKLSKSELETLVAAVRSTWISIGIFLPWTGNHQYNAKKALKPFWHAILDAPPNSSTCVILLTILFGP